MSAGQNLSGGAAFSAWLILSPHASALTRRSVATLVLGIALAGLGMSTSLSVEFVALFTVGLGWLAVLVTLDTAIQCAVPRSIALAEMPLP